VNFTLDSKEARMVFHWNRCWIVGALLSMFLFSGLAWSASDKIDINTATEQELAGLDGIGPAKAKAIVAYRKANGPFKQAEDLMKVSGIGEKTFQNNKSRIAVGGSSVRPSVSAGGKTEVKSTAATGAGKKTGVSGNQSGSSASKTATGTAAKKSGTTTRKDAKTQ
jgi:competence protein ComEA